MLTRWRAALFALVALLVFGGAQAQTCPGVLTDGVYVISNATQLEALRDATGGCLAESYELGDDIDFSSRAAWNKGIASGGDFRGTFDGNEKSIIGLTITSSTDSSFGLFSYSESSVIKDLKLVDVTINTPSGENVGALLGYTYGAVEISNVIVEGATVSGRFNVGGLIGYASADEGGVAITNVSLSDVSVDAGEKFTWSNAGGLIGQAEESNEAQFLLTGITIQDATITGVGAHVGGFVGVLWGSDANMVITNATFSGDVSGDQESVGGLIGMYRFQEDDADADRSLSINGATISGTVSGLKYVGGVLGEIREQDPVDFALTISNVIVNASISDTGDVNNSNSVGGVIGTSEGDLGEVTIEDVTVNGNVTGTKWVGGIVGNSDVPTTLRGIEVYGNVANTGSQSYTGGLFGSADSDVSISDAHVFGNVQSEGSEVGGFAGDAAKFHIESSTVGSAENPVEVKGQYYVGGLIGYAYEGTVTDVVVWVDVEAEYAEYVGGLIGRFRESGEIVGSSAHGSVSVEDDDDYGVGGLVGMVEGEGKILRSYASVNVSASSAKRVGGLIGAAYGSWNVGQSFASGNVDGRQAVGGLIGEVSIDFFGNVQTSFASGAVSGQEAVGGLIGDFVGGFVGDVYASGAVTALASGANDAFGGLIGRISGTNVLATLRNSFAVGAVSGAVGSTNVGGLVAEIGGNWSVDSDVNFWDVDTTGVAVTAGGRGTGLGTDALRTFATFDDAGWKISNDRDAEFKDGPTEYVIWFLCEGRQASGYPRLLWEERGADWPTCGDAPSAPTNVEASPGNAQATVSWTAPSSDGGSAITSYTVTSDPGEQTCVVDSGDPLPTTCTVTGLTNGTAYTFTVTATNAVGTSAPSTASASVTPVSAPAAEANPPGAPTNVLVTPGDAQVSVSWTAPASNGGAAITTYKVTANPGGATCEVTAGDPLPTTCTVTGLTNGVAYTFTVTATNSAGTSEPSSASAAVTPIGIPAAPTGVTLIPGDADAWLLFTTVPGVAAYEVSVTIGTAAPGEWVRVSASDLVLPLPLAPLLPEGVVMENGVQVCAQVRVVLSDGAVGSPSAAVCATPSDAVDYTPAVELKLSAPVGSTDRIELGDDGRLVFDFMLANTGTGDLANVWLKPFVPAGATLISLEPQSGGTLIVFGDTWHWVGANLQANGGTATLRMTVQLEGR